MRFAPIRKTKIAFTFRSGKLRVYVIEAPLMEVYRFQHDARAAFAVLNNPATADGRAVQAVCPAPASRAFWARQKERQQFIRQLRPITKPNAGK